MNEDSFWSIVDSAKQMADSDVDARIDALRSMLSCLTPQELQSFQNHYDQKIAAAYRRDLWGAASIMNGWCSDDGFRYFRDWLISEGRTVYEGVLKNPDSLADLPRTDLADLELFGYVALKLYEQAGAGEIERASPFEGEPAGEPWAEDRVGELFPRLNAIYG